MTNAVSATVQSPTSASVAAILGLGAGMAGAYRPPIDNINARSDQTQSSSATNHQGLSWHAAMSAATADTAGHGDTAPWLQQARRQPQASLSKDGIGATVSDDPDTRRFARRTDHRLWLPARPRREAHGHSPLGWENADCFRLFSHRVSRNASDRAIRDRRFRKRSPRAHDVDFGAGSGAVGDRVAAD